MMDWFRWHHGTVTEPKFRLVAHRSGATVAEVIACWAVFLESASQAENRGDLSAPDFEALDCSLGLPAGRASAIFAEMVNRKLISGLCDGRGRLTAWEKRQPKREREDNSAARVQKFRAKQHQETPSNAEDAQKKPRLDKTRLDKTEAKEEKRRAARLPDDWTPDDSLTAWALEIVSRGALAEIIDNFRDYWRARAGPSAAKLDWSAAFRIWVRREKENGSRGTSRQSRVSAVERTERNAERNLARRAEFIPR